MKPSMKTTSSEGVDNVLDTPSRYNVIGRRVHQIMRTRRSIMKKQLQRSKGFFKHLPSPFLPDDNFEDMDKTVFKWSLSMYRNTGNSSENCDNSVDDIQDATRLLPKELVILCCESCQSYSHSAKGRYWLKALTNHESPLLKAFLLKRLGYYCALLRLRVADSWFVSLDSCHMSVGLKLEFQAPAGVWHERSCVVVYKLTNTICPSCSPLVDETQLRSVVQLRHYVADNTTLRVLQLRVQRTHQPVGSTFSIQKTTPADHGVDFFLPNDRDAMSLCRVLKSYAPVKHDEIHMSSSNADHNTVRYVISAVVPPICKDDLVYLPSTFAATMGVQDVGPLVVCIGLFAKVYFVDPLTLKQCRFDANAYWRNPFLSLKTSRELVEYIIHDVNILLSRAPYTLAEMKVARISDSGSYGTPVLVRTHLGRVLKPGDRALGYDLSDIEIENDKNNMLQHVVLIKKCCFATELAHEFSRKKRSPEYEQFLNDLEKNPEAVFNLSLNAGDAKQQTSEMSLEKPEDLGLDLEDLLADLNLTGQ